MLDCTKFCAEAPAATGTADVPAGAGAGAFLDKSSTIGGSSAAANGSRTARLAAVQRRCDSVDLRRQYEARMLAEPADASAVAVDTPDGPGVDKTAAISADAAGGADVVVGSEAGVAVDVSAGAVLDVGASASHDVGASSVLETGAVLGTDAGAALVTAVDVGSCDWLTVELTVAKTVSGLPSLRHARSA